MLHTKIETAPAPLADAVPQVVGALSTGLSAIAARGAQWRDRYPDDVVIAWLTERNADFLDETRETMATDEFVRTFEAIRQSPENMIAFAAEIRKLGHNDFADAVDEIRRKDAEDAKVHADAPSQKTETVINDPDDAQLLAAWEIRQTELAKIESRGPYRACESHSPIEANAYDRAEVAISRAQANTLAGVLAKLWLGLSHVDSPSNDEDGQIDDYVRRADFSALPSLSEFDFDWEVLLGAIRDLAAIIERQKRADEARADILPARGSAEWTEAVNAYEALRPRLAQKGLTDDEVDALASEQSQLGEALIGIAAPNFAAVLVKLRTAAELQHMVEQGTLEAIIADGERLLASGATATPRTENPALVEAYAAFKQTFAENPSTGDEEKAMYTRQDEADEQLGSQRAFTLEGAAMKLKRAFVGMVGCAWSDSALFEDQREIVRAGLNREGDFFQNIFWNAIEDLERMSAAAHA